MTLDTHARRLGGLLGNFQSLEFVLRVYLNSLPGARPFGLPPGTDLYLFPVGSDLPENDFTSWDSLGQLITKFNGEMKKKGRDAIDVALVEVRDALAHGRVSTSNPEETLRLIKFDKPKNGRVRVTFNEAMSADWFARQTASVLEAISLVMAAGAETGIVDPP